jgi:hypothetical protein
VFPAHRREEFPAGSEFAGDSAFSGKIGAEKAFDSSIFGAKIPCALEQGIFERSRESPGVAVRV